MGVLSETRAGREKIPRASGVAARGVSGNDAGMTLRLAMLVVLAAAVAGCATHVSASKKLQVELATQTGPYAYQRAIGGPPR